MVPWWITRWRPGLASVALDSVRMAGFLAACLGAVALLDTFFRFAWIGRGSPAPALPTETLVVSGLHRYVRNPMYVAVVTIIIGQAIWLWRLELLYYGAAIAVVFHAFVILYEEPSLRARFGQSYLRYCKHVRRWRPRLRPWDPSSVRY